MFISIKMRTILISLAVVVAMVSACCLISAAATGVSAVPKLNKTIVIDAGHGGIDGGVVGKQSGIKEAEINLAIARSLKHFLTVGGYDVIMTRLNADGLYGFATSNRKVKDMEERRKIIANAQPDLVVSVHCNFFPLSSQRGSQVFYRPKSEDGKAMADTMQSILNVSLEASKRVSMAGDYFILQCTQFPSLLVECGFLSNALDEKLLISANYQEKVAYSIYSGINQILRIE